MAACPTPSRLILTVGVSPTVSRMLSNSRPLPKVVRIADAVVMVDLPGCSPSNWLIQPRWGADHGRGRGNARGIRPSGPADPGRRHRDAAARPTRGAPRRLCGGIAVVAQGAGAARLPGHGAGAGRADRKSTRLNSSH